MIRDLRSGESKVVTQESRRLHVTRAGEVIVCRAEYDDGSKEWWAKHSAHRGWTLLEEEIDGLTKLPLKKEKP